MRASGFVAFGGAVMCATALAAADAVTAVGLRQAEAIEYVFQSLSSGSVPWFAARAAFKAAPTDTRTQLVTGVLTWAKGFTESPEFTATYASLRKREEPRPPTIKSADEELVKQQADLDRQIDQARASLAEPQSPRMSPQAQDNVRKGRERRLESLQTQRARFDNPGTRGDLRRMFEEQVKNQQEQYRKQSARWEEQYPADVRGLMAKRLRQFLAVSADVNFAAATIPCRDSYSKHACFADPTYEKKPAEWKLCYRVGKEPVEVARAFAAAWLAEIEKK